MKQLSFNFPFQDNYPAEDFVVSDENSDAFNFISKYNFSDPLKFPKIFAIYGSNCSGKTHLSHIWQKKSKARFIDIEKLQNVDFGNYIEANKSYVIEDIDKIFNQVALFHIFNIICEKEAHLLITSSVNLNLIEYSFADLESRLKNVFSIQIKEPNSDLIKILLVKNFSNRQLKVENKVIDYIAKNIDRHFEAISNISRMLEFYCFEEKRKITIPFVSEVMERV